MMFVEGKQLLHHLSDTNLKWSNFCSYTKDDYKGYSTNEPKGEGLYFPQLAAEKVYSLDFVQNWAKNIILGKFEKFLRSLSTIYG